jgi:hypothetical protein
VERFLEGRTVSLANSATLAESPIDIFVESGEVGLIALPPPARSNGSCSFPASRFPMWVALVGEGWVVFQGRGGSAARGRSLR